MGTGSVRERFAVDPSVALDGQALVTHLVGRDVRVLLFGSAVAELTEELARRGCHVVAVESDAASAAVAAAFAQRIVLADPDNLDYLNELEGTFDVVVFSDFLEYTRSPRLALNAAARLLGTRGAVVVSVRNVRHLSVTAALLTGSPLPGSHRTDLPPASFYTLDSARDLLTACDLEITHLDRVMMSPDLGAAPTAMDGVPPDIAEWLAGRPEADTYQFIFRCVPASPLSAASPPEAASERGDDPVTRLQAHALIEMDATLRQLQSQRTRLDAKLEELADERGQMDADLQHLLGERRRLTTLVDQQKSLIQVYERSRAVKLATALRRMQSALPFTRRVIAPPDEVQLPRSKEIKLTVPISEILAADWTRPRKEPAQQLRPGTRTLTINWVLPRLTVGSGGHTTIFRFVRHLESKGHTCRLYFYYPYAISSFHELADVVRSSFEPMRAQLYPFTSDMKPCDVLIATGWQTAYPVFNSQVRAKKFYMVQDFEPYFYPASTESVLAANTYRFGLHCITAGEWLATKLAQDYGMVCDYFDFGVDTGYVNQGRDSREGVLFYTRATTPRRAFALGVMALMLFHKRHPNFAIHVVGRLANFELPFPYIDHGVLDHGELNSLYNLCAAGLTISLTNNSLVPLELLAAGCIPVVNDAPNTRMTGGSPYVQYADPSPHGLAAALCSVVEREDLAAHAREASESVRHLTWADATAKVESILLRELGMNAP